MILIIVLLVIILIILLRYECLTIDDEPLNNLVTQINNKSLTIDNLNTSNITNKELINSKNITSTEGTIDKLTVNNQLTTKSNLNGYNITSSYITNYGTIKSNGLISHHNVTYLFDTNATINFGKTLNGKMIGTHTFNCVAYGFYDTSSGYAMINTNYVNCNVNISNKTWWALYGLKLNGIWFRCLSYECLSGSNESKINCDYVYGNYPLLPPMVGMINVTYFNGKIYQNCPDNDTMFFNALYPYAYQVNNGSNNYNVYIVKGNNCDEARSDAVVLCIKINDVFMIKSDS